MGRPRPWPVRLLAPVLAALLLHSGPAGGRAQEPPPRWERPDQSGDLAALAGHPDERMRYALLNSRVLDKNDLWAPFAEDLARFGRAGYERLRPMVLNRSIGELEAAVAAGRFSHEELVLFYIYRLRAIETDGARYLNSVIALNPDAVRQARRLDRRRREAPDAPRGPLFGMPVLLKDNIGAAGMATTAGAVALRDNRVGDAFVAARLVENGAVILGKANLSEWAYFFCRDCPSGYSAVGGQTLNPYGRLSFGPGGSSSGNGAAVAADLAAAAVGSETSGSILSPASANSLVGLKPTVGSLSRSGVVPISSVMDTVGPMTRTVADAAILFNAMTGYDADDSAMPRISAGLALTHRRVALAGRRLGAPERFADDPVFQAALAVLSGDGAEIERFALPPLEAEGFVEFLGAEMARDLPRYLRERAAPAVPVRTLAALQAFNLADPEIRAPYGQSLVDMMVGLEPSARGEPDASLAEEARGALEALFAGRRLDALLSLDNRLAGAAARANWPALTVPAGYREDGRPAGLTLIAPPFAEQLLVDIGARFEELAAARVPPPDYRR